MNYYEILQISSDASDEVIKAAYKALAKKYHPDSKLFSPEICEQKMRELNVAFDVLSNTIKRREYDKQCWRCEGTSEFNRDSGKECNSVRDDEDSESSLNTVNKHNKFSRLLKNIGDSINTEIQKRNQIIDNAYLDGMLMNNWLLVRKYRQSAGYRRLGYAKALEEKGLLIRTEDGNFIPTELFREYNY